MAYCAVGVLGVDGAIRFAARAKRARGIAIAPDEFVRRREQ
jgi:hypothetical protein